MQTDPLRRRASIEPPFASASDPQGTATCRHHFACIDGVQVHWAELDGGSDRLPLVLLHGLGDSHRTWRPLVARLARGRRVLMPDLPGHGLSGRPDASYALGWYARVVEHWLDTAGVARADVVGHSFGGGVAQMMLLQCPERIRRLVLVSSGGLGREIAVLFRLASIPLVVERLGQPFMGSFTRLVLRVTGDVISSGDVAQLSAMNAQRGSARAFGRTVHDLIDWRGQRQTFFQRADELSALPPIAVFWGDHDGVIPFAHAESLARFVDGVRVTRFEGCGHCPHHEKPDAFVAALDAFLDSPHPRSARVRRRVPISSQGRLLAGMRSLVGRSRLPLPDL